MVSINSFMFPAVEIAWIDAFWAAALLPEIPAVAMPIAAGESPRMGREEEEGVILSEGSEKTKDLKGYSQKFRVGLPKESIKSTGWNVWREEGFEGEKTSRQ